jgi:ketosteroid isomerase-like protein
MKMLATRVREAMQSADLGAMSELLAPDARWGAPEQTVPTCRNAQEILSWFEVARDNGVRADVTAADVVGERIVVALKIHANPSTAKRSKEQVRWQVMSVRDGRVSEIRGYEKRRDATAFATSGVSNWR